MQNSWRRNRTFVWTAIITLLCLSALHAGEVKTFADPKAEISKYKTYRILPIRALTRAGIVEDDDWIAPMIRSAIRRELSQRGLTEVKTGGDLEVAAGGLNGGSMTLDGFVAVYGFSFYIGSDGVSPVEYPQRFNQEGTLAVALIDPGTKKGVWVGLATESLTTRDKVVQAVDKAASRMFKKFPAKKGS